MLRLVSEKQFNNEVLGNNFPKKIIKNIKNPEFLSKDWPYYKNDSGNYIIWMSTFKTAIIYGENEIDLEKEIIDFSNWTLEKISDIPSSKYILNQMKKYVFLNSNFFEICDKGDWKISNSITHEEIQFTIKVCGVFFKEVAIGYPEKSKNIKIVSEIIKKDKFIEAICYGIRKIDKRGNIKS